MSMGNYTDYLKGDGKSPDLAGNPHDDDPEYIEELVATNSFPVIPPATSMVEPPPTLDKPPTRLLTGYETLTYANIDQIRQVLPRDNNRKSLHLRLASTVSTDYILFADGNNKLSYAGNSGGSFRLDAGSQMCLDPYTGPLFYRPYGLSQSLSANNVVPSAIAQPTSVTGWTKQAADTIASLAAPWDATRLSAKVTSAGGTQMFAISPTNSTPVITTGTTVYFRIKAVLTGSLGAFQVRMRSQTNGSVLAYQSSNMTPTGIWAEYTGSFTMPFTDAIQLYVVTTAAATAADTMQIGDFAISTVGAASKYFDAGTASDSTYRIVANTDTTANAYAAGIAQFSYLAITE